MFAKIGTTQNLLKAFHYNEEKLKQGQAECLLSQNFVKDLHELTEKDKLDRFQQRISLNERSTHNILHISIGFDTSEKISNEQMQTLAKRYMTNMGFKKQPILVYRHYDTAHPHCHILTTNIRADGTRIELTIPEYRKSQQITRDLEQEFSLSRYETVNQENGEKFRVKQAQRVIYGQTGIKHSISDVLNTVVDHYKYTTLAELNAVLVLYNVRATRGSENSQLYRHRGLLYHAIDDNGKRKGKSIKASDFLLKPTLVNLEKKFALNISLKEGQEQRIITAIDWVFAGTPPHWKGLQQDLEREGIDIVVQADKKGNQEGAFFVDHNSKCVFTGESLGEQYLLEAIQERCSLEQSQEQELEEIQRHRLHLGL